MFSAGYSRDFSLAQTWITRLAPCANAKRQGGHYARNDICNNLAFDEAVKNDDLVKSYIMLLRDTVTENNLSIISKSYDLVI